MVSFLCAKGTVFARDCKKREGEFPASFLFCDALHLLLTGVCFSSDEGHAEVFAFFPHFFGPDAGLYFADVRLP